METLVDGDVITYISGFASQTTLYEYEGESYTSKKALYDDIPRDSIRIELLSKTIVPGTLEVALGNTKRLLETILNRTDAHAYRIFLSGEGSFRKEHDPTYKANRDSSHKPVHYSSIRSYLVDHWDAVLAREGLEADDELGIHQHEQSVIASIDKDLLTIPGLHWNIRRYTLTNISSFEATRNFYTQLLVGDRSDNIQGIPHVGATKARMYLKHCETEKELYETVKRIYKDHYSSDEEADTLIRNRAKLLWIKRSIDSEWSPPT